MRVEVTEEHICLGTKGSHHDCAVALAICEDPAVVGCSVDGATATVEYESGEDVEYDLDGFTMNWIKDWDFGIGVEPFTFILEETA